jgi:FliI/YscN family ATPase
VTLPASLHEALQRAQPQNRPLVQGRVRSLVGIALEVEGMRAAIGDLCTIHSRTLGGMPAEVVGFRRDASLVLPLLTLEGIAPHDVVTNHERPLQVPCGDELLGRAIDALGRPLDGGKALRGPLRSVLAQAPPALTRAPIRAPIETGISAIDGFLTCGRGQRVGIFSGSGVGKSTLLGMIARGSSAQVNVIALVGERGREVREFLEHVLGAAGLRKSVVVVATSDAPPMLRCKAPYTAVAIAEHFRQQGRDVLFLMDSVTRFAGACREIGLAIGEPPTLRGYPPSLFAHLPRLIERLGNDDRGSITGMLTVLVEGDDLNEPVADAVRGYLDGHIVLSRAIAQRARFPAVDVLQSVSRLMPQVTAPPHLDAARGLRELLAHWQENQDLVQVGAYKKGSDALLDRAIARIKPIEELLYQGSTPRPLAETLRRMQELAG